MANKDFSMNYHVGRRAAKNSFIGKVFILIFFVLLIIFVFKNISLKNKSVLSTNIISPLATTAHVSKDLQNKQIATGLGGVVQDSLQGTSGTYAVVILNLKTGEEYHSNQNLVFDSASLYKLWVMAVVYQQIEKGNLSLDLQLSANVADLNKKFNIDNETAEKKDGVITMPVKDALFAMITKSDNYSALLLSSKIGLFSIQNFLVQNGLINSKVGVNGKSPTTTAYDTALFLDKLYNGELASAPVTSDMISFLKQQVLNEKIPKYLPDDAIVAHKTGELDNLSHDAGIIYTANNQYIIAVLSKSDDPQSANEIIANLSKSVYEYFEK